MSTTPINQAHNILFTQQQNVQQEQQQQLDIQQKFANIISAMLQVTNDLAYEISTIEDEKCQKCPIVTKCRQLIRLLKEMIELQRQIRK